MDFLPQLPHYLPLLFIATTFLTVILINAALKKSPRFGPYAKWISIGLVLWLALQLALSYSGLYYKFPEQFPLPILPLLPPALILTLYLFISKKGKAFIDDLPMEQLIWISIVRIPVEITLYGLFLVKAVPEIMTFAGLNFDILAGLTAPIIAYYGIRLKKFNKTILLIWNIIGLLLLINIIVIAILSAPFPIQQFAFEQPNIAVLRFPFSWLPSFVAPVVLISHLIMIRRLVVRGFSTIYVSSENFN